ncbi:uncharacterized protein LOC108925132 [Scleropages formosus]|uniref:uncharacterized protein LOC108925132 n=1 Tax=Scleropages formosus TaxID=113540 RepID=UPI0008788195|nr:uncharacterized protein LOC108925132 [Scleropages formosus]XP_018592411.1 uncharacterized protein LOC108925132 [Scleropages formosus]
MKGLSYSTFCTMSRINHTVFALIFVILFLKFPPVPGQTVTSQQALKEDVNSQTTEVGVTEPLEETSHPPEATSPTLNETFISSVEQTTAVGTTSGPGLGTSPSHFSTIIPTPETTAEAVRPSTAAAAPQKAENVTTEGISTESTTPPKIFTSSPSITATEFNQKTERSTTEDVSENITVTSATHLILLETTSPTPAVTHAQSASPAETSSTLNPVHTIFTTPANRSGSTPWILIIILIVCIICVVLIITACVNKRKKKRSETFRSSLRNGGSHKAKKKKGAGSDAWAGPVALNGDKDWEAAAEDGGKGEETLKQGDEVEVVLSTFTAQDKEDGKGDAGEDRVRPKDEDNKAEEVPLLSSAKDPEEEIPLPEPLEGREGEEDEGETFCMTSAV